MGTGSALLARAMGLNLKCIEEGANFRVGPVLGPDELAANNAFSVDDVGFRPHVGVVELGGRLGGVAHRDQVHVAAGDEAGVGVGIFVDADGQDDEIGPVVVKLEKRWQFNHAGLAPRCPEVEQHNLAAIAGKVDGGGAVGDGEIRGGFAGLGGMSAAVAGADEGQRQGENQVEGTRKPHILIIRSDGAETKGLKGR